MIHKSLECHTGHKKNTIQLSPICHIDKIHVNEMTQPSPKYYIGQLHWNFIYI